jgi:hypothetical protein
MRLPDTGVPEVKEGVLRQARELTLTSRGFETIIERRQGHPLETRIKKGVRSRHCGKVLGEKLGPSDPCACGPGPSFSTPQLPDGRSCQCQPWPLPLETGHNQQKPCLLRQGCSFVCGHAQGEFGG